MSKNLTIGDFVMCNIKSKKYNKLEMNVPYLIIHCYESSVNDSMNYILIKVTDTLFKEGEVAVEKEIEISVEKKKSLNSVELENVLVPCAVNGREYICFSTYLKQVTILKIEQQEEIPEFSI